MIRNLKNRPERLLTGIGGEVEKPKYLLKTVFPIVFGVNSLTFAAKIYKN
jgi:hypothetical protein